MKKNIVIIGLGSMGKRRIRLLKELYPENRYIGIDSNIDRAIAVRDEYNMDVFRSLDELQQGEIFAAFICTSPKSHATLIEQCLMKGWHVFTEINLLSDKYEENIELAKRMNRTLFLSSTTIYKEEIRYIAKRVQETQGKKAYSYHVGQYLPDWHPWDILKDFFVSDKATNGCRELMAIEFPWMLNTFGKVIDMHVIHQTLTGLNLGFPDTYSIQFEHENGIIGNVMIDVVSRQAVRRLEIIGENLYITWDGTPETLYEKELENGQLKCVHAGEYIHDEHYGSFINEYAYMQEIEEFFKVIEGKIACYGFEDDLNTLSLIDQIEGKV